MSGATKISWAENSWNPVLGCSKCSPGCRSCYAERMANRLAGMGKRGYPEVITKAGGAGHWNGKTVLVESELDKPLHWRKPRTIFVDSMSDLFHESVPFGRIDRVYAVMALCPQHRFMVLTKRPQRMAEYWSDEDRIVYISIQAQEITNHTNEDLVQLFNIYHGVTVCNQAEADEKLPVICQIPGPIWISIEPMLDRVNVVPYIGGNSFHCECGWHETEMSINWFGDIARCIKCGKRAQVYNAAKYVVVGGETGPGARPLHPDWVRSVRDQCAAAGVKFHFKSWGEWRCIRNASHIPGSYKGPMQHSIELDGGGEITGAFKWGMDDHSIRYVRVGRKAAGHLLDGREHREKA